jgi:hypothetical protein
MVIDEQLSEGTIENFDQKLRGGLPALGVEGFPKTGRPLDPEPGLGGTFKCRPVPAEIKHFF